MLTNTVRSIKLPTGSAGGGRPVGYRSGPSPEPVKCLLAARHLASRGDGPSSPGGRSAAGAWRMAGPARRCRLLGRPGLAKERAWRARAMCSASARPWF